MTERKFAKTFSTITPVIAVIALCFSPSAAKAQTPAQDSANVAADKQAIDDAQHAIDKVTLQMTTDTNARNEAALQADTTALAADKQALSDANDKLKTDMQQLTSDDQYFNGTSATPPAQPQGNAATKGATPPTGTNTGASTTTPGGASTPSGTAPATVPAAH